MSDEKLLSELVKLIFVDFKQDQNGIRALKRIHMAQVNMVRRMRPKEVKLLENLKPFFKKKRRCE